MQVKLRSSAVGQGRLIRQDWRVSGRPGRGLSDKLRSPQARAPRLGVSCKPRRASPPSRSSQITVQAKGALPRAKGLRRERRPLVRQEILPSTARRRMGDWIPAQLPSPLSGSRAFGRLLPWGSRPRLLHRSQRWNRDAVGRGGPERFRRFGDDPPSPWPAEDLVERLGRLYGTAVRWQRMVIAGASKNRFFQRPRNPDRRTSLRGSVETPQTMCVNPSKAYDGGASPRRRNRSCPPRPTAS
jgi:hypothetical protein